MERTLWAMAYVSVLSIRLHPKNDREAGTHLTQAITVARWAADAALEDFKEKFPCQRGSQAEPQ